MSAAVTFEELRSLCISARDAARCYARLGLPVFPVHWVEDGRCSCGTACCSNPGKHPFGKVVPRGHLDATTDLAEIEECWSALPLANIGIRTGEVSGLVVLDVDPRNGGDASLERLQGGIGKLPPTLTVKTGGGGYHLYFRYPLSGGKIAAKLDGYPGIDVKADGGYVLAPPSSHISGRRYEWARP